MTLVTLVFAAAFAAFVAERLKLYLLYFQQEEYDQARFFAWWREASAYDTQITIGLGALAVATIVLPAPFGLLALAAGAGLFLWRRSKDRTFLAESKKPLVMTQRATRIHRAGLALVLVIFALALVAFGSTPWAVLLEALALTQAAPFLLAFGNELLGPYERRIQKGFLEDARTKLRKLDPHVIGITGSFGKTSTKMILSHVLEAARPTLATPGSVNTEMGISRIVRERLTPEHAYFIAEMGAYGPGSIARLCDLAPPKLSLLTAVGEAHYERFKSLETVFAAKMEIAEAAMAQGGKTILNIDGIPHEFLHPRIVQDGRENFILVGKKADGFDPEFEILSATVTKEGTELRIAEGGEEHRLVCPLYGTHQAGNIAVAFATARTLGMPAPAIAAALKTVPQVKHRLEVQKADTGPTIIDDGYNSNPIGFRAALDLLDLLTDKGSTGRRVLITPGMVEMGARHDEAHAEIGAYAADRADIVIAVTPERMRSFVDALKTGDPAPELLEVSAQSEAETWLRTQSKPGDVILLENSLPDLYERAVSL